MKTMRHKGKRLLHRPEDRKGRRLLAGVLCVCLLLPNLEHFVRGLDPAAEGLCEHHPVHDVLCGYAEERGKQIMDGAGRPGRMIEINFQQKKVILRKQS